MGRNLRIWDFASQGITGSNPSSPLNGQCSVDETPLKNEVGGGGLSLQRKYITFLE